MNPLLARDLEFRDTRNDVRFEPDLPSPESQRAADEYLLWAYDHAPYPVRVPTVICAYRTNGDEHIERARIWSRPSELVVDYNRIRDE